MGAASEELTERAKLLISERRYQEAVRACRRALLSKPGQIEIRLLLGEALLALERYDEVRVEMMALARKVPERAVVHRLLGEAYLRDGRPTQAIESLRRALQLDPHDEVAEELIAEAADENAPVSTTIERWFADEAEPTIETESPAWEEVSTPVPSATHPSALVPAEPSVQIDPSLVEEALVAGSRSSKPTITGHADFALSPAPAADAPLPPPPTQGSPLPKARRQLGRVGPPPSAPPPAAIPRPRSPDLRPLASGLPPSDPFPVKPLPEEETHAARPSRMRDLPEPPTDELSLEDLEPEELSPVQIMEGEPTRARPGPSDVPSDIDDYLIDDDSPTLAFGGLSDVDGDLIGEPTQARAPASPSEVEPPTFEHYPAPRYKSTPYAEPDEPPTTPAQDRPRPAPAPPPSATPMPPPAAPSTTRVRRTARRWLMPAVTGVLGLLVLGAMVAFGVSVWRASTLSQEIHAAAAEAGDTGSRSATEAVIERIGETDDEEMMALRARLIATLVYEHGEDRAAEVRAVVDRVTASEATTDVRIAAALLALSEGDPQEAGRDLDRLEAQGDQIPEAFRAHAFVMAARGEWGQAYEAAARAVEARPSAPRHIALQALMRHMTGGTDPALTLLDGTLDAEHQPAVRIVRARILADTGSDPSQAVQEASAVIDDLADRATPSQLAWAHLIRAAEGPPAQALEEARAAAENPPPLDEAFGMQLARVFLRHGAPQDADLHLGQLSETVVIDVPGRALLTAEVALAVNQLSRAEEALGNAGSGSRQNLLRARIYEARNQSEAARPLYERVMNEDPGPEGRSAAVRLAHIEMTEGNTARVVSLLEPRQPEAVDDLDLVPLLARAYLARDRAGDAGRIVDAALRRRPNAPELKALRGAVLLANGSASEAVSPLTEAAEALPRDARVRADLGRAHQLTGHREAATAAYEATLEIEPANVRALVGLAQIAFESGDYDQAEQRVTAAANTGQEGLAVARLRARLEVVRGAGASGVSAVRALSRQHEDAIVWTALGDLYAQAEQDRSAGRAYEHALQLEAEFVEALIGQTFLQIRAGQFSRAERTLVRAEAAAQAAGTSAEAQPRIDSARGWLDFEAGSDRYDAAVTRANAAIEADEHLSSAHLLLGTIAIERGQDPIPELRRAAAARAPSPEALGQLAPRLPAGEEACRVARRYLAAAPDGYDSPDVQRVVRRCPEPAN